MELINESTAMSMFDEYFNDMNGIVDIGGFKYPAAYALRMTDPVAYREEMLNTLDDMGFDIV